MAKKNLVSGPILAHLAQIRSSNFLFFFSSKIWLRQYLDIIVQLSNVWLSNFETNENDFIGRCSTNIERLVEENGFHWQN